MSPEPVLKVSIPVCLVVAASESLPIGAVVTMHYAPLGYKHASFDPPGILTFRLRERPMRHADSFGRAARTRGTVWCSIDCGI